MPLDDIRVLEFSIGIAAPTFGRYFAHHGADVIRVESRRKPDSLRLGGSGWVPLDFDIAVRGDTGPLLNVTNAQKRSLGLEVRHPAGRTLLDGLLKNTDIVVSNLSADVLASWNMAYEDVRRLRSDIIYVTLPGFGSQIGPYRNYRTWGPNQAPLGGIDYISGWPDRGPMPMSISYPDYVAGYFAATTALAALLERDLTGEGCEIDLSQYETTIACVGPFLLEYLAGGQLAGRTGNHREGFAPHGVYPTRDPERWVAVAVEDDAAWSAFCAATGHADWAIDERFATQATRLANQDALDDLVGTWSARFTAWEVAETLQSVGVAAAPVFDDYDLMVDQHLAARDYWRVLPHMRFGRDLIAASPVRLSATPARYERASPALGEDTRAVLVELLGLTDSEIDDLAADGAVYLTGEPNAPLERPYLHWIRHVMRGLPWPESVLDLPQAQLERLSGRTKDGGL